MRTLQLSMVGAVIMVLLGGLGGVVLAQAAEAPEPQPERLLFVGNSLTYRKGGVDAHVAGLAASESEAITLEVEASTSPGATLYSHALLGDVEETIRDGRYDVVVLQGDIPANGRVEPFIESARVLDAAVDASGARTLFFMTWPWEDMSWAGLDDIVAAHRQVEDELGATVAPVGVAMENALAERPELATVMDGRGHTTAAGTYLAAATIYGTLFDRSPEGLPYRPEDIPADDAAFLQRIAWETVLEWQAGAAPAE